MIHGERRDDGNTGGCYIRLAKTSAAQRRKMCTTENGERKKNIMP
jgi:hypothetical protein